MWNFSGLNITIAMIKQIMVLIDSSLPYVSIIIYPSVSKKYFNYGAMFSFSRLLDCGLLLWLEAGAISWQLYILVRGCGNFSSCQPESHIFAQLPLRNNTLFLFSECMCCSIYYVVLTRYWITWNRICLCSHASCALREVWRPNWWFPLQPPRSAARSVSEARPRCLEQDTQREHEG